MKTVDEFPYAVRELEHVWIPMRDGCRLAARVWIPEDAEKTPVPAILEYIPYRKRDLRTIEDSVTHPYYAGHGYAGVRVDLRGSGESEGVLRDEYDRQEWDDGLDVLEWLSQQPWCDGTAGMMGISWGGFNALQLAALDPPQLKAIVTVCSTDDRYADDVHYMGGCLLGDNLSWASVMFMHNSCPPDPELVGERWRQMWLKRLKESGLWLETWRSHQRRDAYWKHGSVCEDYAAIRCPVFAVSGWADGYSNAVFRLLSNLDVPCKGLIGPWSHKYPHLGMAGPAIGFLQETLRWWDYWLKGIDTQVMDEPPLRVWMQHGVAPSTRYDVRPGRWVAEPSWPSLNIESAEYGLTETQLVPDGDKATDTSLRFRSPLRTGLFAGKWCSYAAGPDLPDDQREDDAGSLTFDTEPLSQPLELLGAPVVELELSVDRPMAMLAVRLCDVDEFGTSARVTYGLLNLTHRDGHESPEALEPGRRYPISVRLNETAYSFPRGHRIRLALSTSYWPLAWPPPETVTMTLRTKPSRLLLPVRPPRTDDESLRPFPQPAGSPLVERRMVEPENYDWRIIRDLETGDCTLEVHDEQGVFVIEDIGMQVELRGREWYRIRGDDIDSIRGHTLWIAGFQKEGWSVKTATETVLTSTPTAFRIEASLEAWEGETSVHRQTWEREIPRDLV